jgi:integral membrane protein (TIGR01906 family)
MNQTFPNAPAALTWLISLLVPVALILAGVRLIMTPLFLNIEYRTPGFPPDLYGFTLEDRLRWAGVAVDILAQGQDLDAVRALTFEDGTSVYNERELKHWDDVIRLWSVVRRVWWVVLAALAALAVWAWRAGWLGDYSRALGRGGFLTLAVMGAVLLFALLAFGVLFVGFHQLFFPPGTWTFPYSDTFIRLFPQRFWRDTFVAVGLFAGGAGALLWHFLARR